MTRSVSYLKYYTAKHNVQNFTVDSFLFIILHRKSEACNAQAAPPIPPFSGHGQLNEVQQIFFPPLSVWEKVIKTGNDF